MHRRPSFKAADPGWDTAEAAWLQALASGGPQARQALEALHGAYARLFLKQLVFWGVSVEDAKDVTQQLWMEIEKVARRYRGDAPVRVYLRGVLWQARTHFFSELGRLPPMASLADEAVVASAEAALRVLAPAASSDPGWLDFMRCVRGKLQAFANDHPRLAVLLWLRHVEEHSLEEMAGQVGGTAQQLKADVFVARRKFEPLVQPCLALWPMR